MEKVGKVMGKIILFGCGTLGYEALMLIGEENVAFFCDNNKTIVGTKKYNKRVVSALQLKEESKDAIVVICAAINKAYGIAKQLEDIGIGKYWFYELVKENLKVMDRKGKIEFLSDETLLVNQKCKFYLDKVEKLEHQVEYFKGHVDIRSVKPAKGKLRERQLRLVKFADEFFDMISELDIHPFLYAGNLLGYVRHNGFIPWDDDIDFGLIRAEYEVLKKYLLENKDEKGHITFEKESSTLTILVSQFHNVLSVTKVGDEKQHWIDFLSFDYYREEYSFREYREYAKNLRMQCIALGTEEERIAYVEEKRLANGNVVDKSNRIFMGFDNMDSYMHFEKGDMMSADIVFPLKKVLYEEKVFWVPNKEEEFLTYLYAKIWDYPEDVGVAKHLELEE